MFQMIVQGKCEGIRMLSFIYRWLHSGCVELFEIQAQTRLQLFYHYQMRRMSSVESFVPFDFRF